MTQSRTIIASVILVSSAGACTPSDRDQVTATVEPPVPVVTAPVRQQDVPIVLTGLGTVQALNTATIRSQVTGYLEAVTFKEGQTVKKGDVLARIDPRIYRAKLGEAQGQLGREQALLQNQQVNLGREEPLQRQGFASDQQVAGQKARVAQTQSAIQGAEATIDYAQTELDFATLTAPFDGVTGFRLIDVGNLVRPTDPGGIVVLTQMQPIAVIFTLDAADIPKVQAALARGAVAATVYDQAGDRKLDAGTLLLIDNTAQTRSGTVRLKAEFPNADRQLWPGVFVNAQLMTSVVKDALTVPTDALQRDDRGPFVFVVGGDHKVAVRAVKVAQRVRGTALISDGLKAGETVVVKGQYRLTPGTAVVDEPADKVADVTPASAGLLP